MNVTVIARVAVRPIRTEFTILAILSAFVSTALALIAGRIEAVLVELDRCGGPTACQGPSQTLATLLTFVPLSRLAAFLLPLVGGLILGTSLVATDLDRRTAVFAWSITPSRSRWLLERVLVLGSGAVMFALPVAFAAFLLQRALGPEYDAALSIGGADNAGLLLVSQSILAFSIAGWVGSISGRSLSSALASVVVIAAVIGGLTIGFSAWRQAEAVPLDEVRAGALVVDFGVRDPDGRLLSVDDAMSQAARSGTPFDDRFTPVVLGLRESNYSLLVAGEAGIEAVTTAFFVGLTFIAVQYRRPQ